MCEERQEFSLREFGHLNTPLDASKSGGTRTELETHRRSVLRQHAHLIDAQDLGFVGKVWNGGSR